jgi:Sec7-like guanine-nucleotide exchange factor
MAVTVAQVGDKPYYIDGAMKHTVTDVTMDSAYATGGETVTCSDLRLNYIDHAEAKITVPSNATDALSNAQFVRSSGITGLVKLYDNTPAEITASDNVSSCVVRIHAWGY